MMNRDPKHYYGRYLHGLWNPMDENLALLSLHTPLCNYLATEGALMGAASVIINRRRNPMFNEVHNSSIKEIHMLPCNNKSINIRLNAQPPLMFNP